MPDEYRVRDPDTNEVISNQTDATINDAVNRFARSASATFSDRGSDLVETFPDYSVWDIDLKPVGSSTWQRRFSGFVVEQDFDDSDTSIDFLSHDHWLKRRTVDREFVDMDATDIVIEIVEDFTPLSVAPADVVFEDEPTGVTERYKGVTPAEIIATLTEASANEQFGATNDVEFFLRPFDADEADLSLTPGRYLATDWEDDNRAQVNQVRVKYGADGNNEVVVSDKAAQSNLGDSIGSGSGVILEQTRTFEGIPAGEQSTARAKAEAILQRGEPIQIGSIETFNVGAVRPGQVVDVVDDDAGVDGAFRVAEVALDATGTDTLTVAENRGGVIDKLASLSEEQDRIEARAGELDPDASTEFLTQQFGVQVNWDVRLLERTFLDRQLILGSESETSEVTTIASGETLTVNSGETLETDQIELGGELVLNGGVELSSRPDAFDPRGGAVGLEFVRTPRVETVASGTTLTIDSGDTLRTGSVELNGEIELNGELRLDAPDFRPTDGGFLGDGFQSQTELVDTA